MKKIFFIFICLAVTSAFSEEAKTTSVVDEIQNAFGKVQTIKTDFTQTIKSSRFGQKKTEGTLQLERPGKMIWKYTEPKGRFFLADGEMITLYDPEEKQALLTKQPKGADLPAGFSFLMGNSDLQKIFNVDIIKDEKNEKGNREVTLHCIPKKEDADFKVLDLTFEWSPTIQLVRSKTKDMLDSENDLVFRNMKLNAKISPSEFKAKYPKSIPLVTVDSISK